MPGCSEPSAGISQAETCGEKGEKSRRTSWQPAEVRSLIAAYRDNYDRLRSTKSSHGQKNVCDSIKEDFLSSCSDAGIETEKTLAQVKEKWRSLFDKYKAVKDNNNKTGRDRRTFGFYDEIDEFMSGSDKVNPKFVKETRVMQVRPEDSPTSSDSGSSEASATVTIAEKNEEEESKPRRKGGRKYHSQSHGGTTSSHRESRRERRTDVRGFVKIPKRLSTKTPGIYSLCPGQTGRDFLFEKNKEMFS